MSMHGDPEETYAALKAYAYRAMSRGLALIHGAFEEYLDAGGRRATGEDVDHILTGVCALGAYNATAGGDDVLPLPKDDDAMCAAWDAIEHGWDSGSGEWALSPDGEPYPAQWVAVGVRLRAEFNPRPARLS